MDAHPYSPKNLILPGFVPNLLTTPTIFGGFVAISIIALFVTWIFVGLLSKVTKQEKLLICWFVFSGLIHMIIEGYFVFTPDFYKDNSGFFLDEMWKEYSKCDSRYVSYDSGVVALELVTVVAWGPLCLLAAYAIATQKSYQHVLQLVVALGEFYGVVLYFISAILAGDHFSTSPFYYYAYYIGTNSPWILIPFLIIIRSWIKITDSEGIDKEKIQ